MTTIDLIKAASALLTSCDGLPPEEMDAAITAWIDGATDKAAALQAVISRAEADAAYLHGEAAAITTSAKRRETAADRCRKLLVSLLRQREELGEKAVFSGPGWSATLRVTRAVVVRDPTAIPGEYLRTKTTTEPDKAAIKAAIEDGTLVPGADLATNHSVTIRKSA